MYRIFHFCIDLLVACLVQANTNYQDKHQAFGLAYEGAIRLEDIVAFQPVVVGAIPLCCTQPTEGDEILQTA